MQLAFGWTQKINLTILLRLLTGACAPHLSPKGEDHVGQHANLIIVIDGLRPDYITPDYMPNLRAFGERGVVAERHTSAFPSITRVNSASTGEPAATPTPHGYH